MNKDQQVFLLFWFLFTLPMVLAGAHRLGMALGAYFEDGSWIGVHWVKEEPPWLFRFIGRLKG